MTSATGYIYIYIYIYIYSLLGEARSGIVWLLNHGINMLKRNWRVTATLPLFSPINEVPRTCYAFLSEVCKRDTSSASCMNLKFSVIFVVVWEDK